MDDHVEASDNCKRQRVCEEQVEDRISSLPDSILIHILSFLPTQDAVRTVLVPRFRHLWNFLPCLTFDQSWYSSRVFQHRLGDGPFYNENFLDFVRHVLICHQNATIDKFVLKVPLNFKYSLQVAATPGYEDFANREKRMASEVDSWLYFAMRKKVKVLHLDFMPEVDPEPAESYWLPSAIFRGEYLTELKLVGCEIKPSSQVQLNCLKRLVLKEIFLNDEILNQVLDGCSVLEKLSLISCYGLCRLGFRNLSIKSLLLSFNDEERLEISCPNIESLDIYGDLEYVDLVDVSSVVVSSTIFDCFEYSPGRYKTVETFFKNLGHCKVFRPCDSCIMVFSAWQLREQRGLLFGWKCLEFEVGLTKWHLPGISCLLRTSPNLETLAMFFDPVHEEDPFTLGDDFKWMEAYDFDAENFWRSQEGTFDCLKYHLKAIKMNGQIRDPYVMDFVEFLLKNAMVLEKFEISTRNTSTPYSRKKVALTTKRRLEFSLKLLSLPRASSSAVIMLS